MRISMKYSIKKRPKRKSEEVSSKLFVREVDKKQKWQDVQFLSAEKDGIDCGDRQCFLEYKVLPDCFIYLETNNTNCIIPCKLEGCEREFHHFIVCPLWHCEVLTTSTKSTTSTTASTTSMTTTSFTTPSSTTTERPSSHKMSALIYTSIVFNIFLFAILFAFVIHKIRARWQRYQLTRPQNSSENERPLPPDPNQYYSIGSSDSETDPLITPEKRKSVAKSKKKDLKVPVPTTIVNENITVDVEPPPSVQSAEPQPSCSHWQDVDLTVPESPSNNESAAILNEPVTQEPLAKKESGSVFLKMKIFNKK